jgi:acetyltransferase
VGIVDETGLREAYRAVRAAAASAAPDAPIGGVLIAEMKRSGIELILGLHRDPEMGAVVLFGVGGVDLELFPDSAVAAPPLDERRARDLIARTRVGRLIRGYRGRPPLDEAPLVAALVNLSRLAVEAGDRIESVDVNPFLLTEKEGVALDALVVKRRSL